jgi:putative MATE family efflux protein
MWNVIFYVCTPLALYQSLNQLFKILDSIMAAHISAESVSAVAYLSQINLMLSAIGGGLAIGSSLKISEAYGAGNYELVKTRVSSLFGICGLLGLGILIFILPFTTKFLELANTPKELIAVGSTYFIIELIAMVISFFNNVYIAIERARGNSKRILYLNLFVIAVKLTLTACFVYVLKSGITMIAVATVVANLIISISAIINMRQKDNAFGFSIKSVSLKSKVVAPMLKISFPVMIEKVAFAFGKVIINSMSTMYGVLTVGALGISNNIGGLTTTPQNGFQEGAAAIISQNLGANNLKRALDAFKKVLIINIILGVIGMFLSLFFLDSISMLFAGSDQEFAKLIAKVYSYEALGAIALGINSAVMSLLYGFGYTKLTLLINFSRVFIFRVPILWALQRFTNLGSESVGIVMMVSNILVGALAVVIAVVVVKKVLKEKHKWQASEQ